MASLTVLLASALARLYSIRLAIVLLRWKARSARFRAEIAFWQLSVHQGTGGRLGELDVRGMQASADSMIREVNSSTEKEPCWSEQRPSSSRVWNCDQSAFRRFHRGGRCPMTATLWWLNQTGKWSLPIGSSPTDQARNGASSGLEILRSMADVWPEGRVTWVRMPVFIRQRRSSRRRDSKSRPRRSVSSHPQTVWCALKSPNRRNGDGSSATSCLSSATGSAIPGGRYTEQTVKRVWLD